MRNLITKTLCLIFLCGNLLANAQESFKVEYFWDTDPGHGNATMTTTTNVTNIKVAFNNLDYGVHTLWFRSQDCKGNWSATVGKPILIKKDVATSITELEYFWDTDPGYGKGYQLNNIATAETKHHINSSEIDDGAHILNLRAKDNKGQWSTVISKPIYVYSINSNIYAMEYFIDNDPGEGNATMVDIAKENHNQSSIKFSIDTQTLNIGTHQLNVRIKDCFGNWSILNSEPFEITEDNGVENIEFTMPISIHANNGVCVLNSDMLTDGNYNVSIIAVDGHTFATETWNPANNTCEIYIGTTNQPIFVIIENGHNRIVKRIIAK